MSDNHHNTSDNHSAPLTAADSTAWDQKDREHNRRANELLPANKTVLFDALAAAGITIVTVHFDGYGDEGQMENIWANASEASVELPEDRIEIINPIWGSSDLERQTVTVREAIEHMTYNFLKHNHDCWEDGEGAFGDFMFDVAQRTITLDYNERYIDTDSYQHEF
jgi:hypothetical protein